mgnify:CR=1 FL=1
MAINPKIRPLAPELMTGASKAEVEGSGRDDAVTSAFAHLLKLESEARRSRSIRELEALLTNECRKLMRARQIFVVECRARSHAVVAMSSVAMIDRSMPIVQWIEAITAGLNRDVGLAKPAEFELPAYANEQDALTREYPFRFVLWQPMWSMDGRVRAGSILLRESPWLDADRKIAARLGETFGHARSLLGVADTFRVGSLIKRKHWIAVALAIAAAGMIPVPISVLAPVEVVPSNADVIAMPIEGIVQKVLIQPNVPVDKGTPLVKIVDTVHRNRAEVAQREVAVAAARLERATSLAFTDPRGRQELGIARAELALKIAEHSYARDILAQTVIGAIQPGIAVFSDPKDVEGKPLGVGERLMLIAREGDAELRISLPVADSIVLRPGLLVKAFLDADPLNAAEAEVSHVDYQAKIDDSQIAAYSVTARLKSGSIRLRLGSRGTAQILGERAPLFLYLFRRPLAALRQRSGL